jgi:hypothetical protein
MKKISSVFLSFVKDVLYLVKFGYSEKATKFEKNVVLLLTRASCSVHATAYLSKLYAQPEI